jgi:uncharacterized damage-inducible protein DinB
METPKVVQQEPWLRETLTELPAVVRAVIHALEMTQEDALSACGPLTHAELIEKPMGVTAVGFHLLHINGSLDRLLTYAEGGQLSPEQVAVMRSESALDAFAEHWQEDFVTGLQRATERVKAFAGADLEQPRFVGRKQLPTSVGGLLVHCADHSLRHVGQIVTTARLVLELRIT